MNVQTINFDKSGMYRCAYKSNLTLREHIHQCVEIIYIIEGEAQMKVGEEEKVLKQGEVAVISPFVSHVFTSANNIKAWLCVFSNDLLTNFLPRAEIYRARNTSFFKLSDRLSAYLDGSLPDSGEEMVPFNYDDRRMIMSIIVPIINEYMEATTPIETGASKPTLLSEILLYLDKNYEKPLSINDVARALGYTPRHISRQLSELKIYNFRTLLNNFRIEHAKLMIRNSDTKLVNISVECGFSSERSFFRSFAKIEGITPTEYRKVIKKGTWQYKPGQQKRENDG